MLKQIILILLFITSQVLATTWMPVYPYTQKTEKGVMCKSIPYDVHNGPYGVGETFVYHHNKLLYSIDQYITDSFFTFDHGKYLIIYSTKIDCDILTTLCNDNKDNCYETPFGGNNKLITIYKNGHLLKEINFEDITLNNRRIHTICHYEEYNFHHKSDWQPYNWGFHYHGYDKNKYIKKLDLNPVFLEKGILKIVTADYQLLNIDIKTGKISNQLNCIKIDSVYEEVQFISNNIKHLIHKKRELKVYQRVYDNNINYPYKSDFPSLQNNDSLHSAIASFLNLQPTTRNKGKSSLYIHTLLINSSGTCDDVYLSFDDILKTKEELTKLKHKIELWIYK